MMPLADLVFDTGTFSNRQLIYAIPCSIIAAMSIEQMGAGLLAFEGMSILSLLIQKKRIPAVIWIQTAITFVAFVILFMAPGNEMRVASEITTWMPGYKELSVGNHLFMTIQWMLSSFANEGKAFFIAIWVAGFLLLMKSKKAKVYQILAVVFSVAAILPYAGITFFSEMGIGDIDIEQCLMELPTWQSMTTQNRIAFFWWIAAVLFTLVLLWKVTGHSVFISMVFLGGIASEAVLYFSPTIYASGARVYYLTDLMYLFIILWMVMHMDSEKKKNLFIAGVVMINQQGLQPLNHSLSGLPQWVSERILQQINQLTHYEPVIGIMGKTGAGKSSLCNALFAGEVSPVSDVAACTREPLRFRLQVGERYMTLVDLPGVGESGARDTEYAGLYREQLPRLDLVLWLIKADDRALAVDEHFYRQVIGEAYRHKVLFVISQSDKTEPTSGGERLSTEQKQNISRKICLLHEIFQPVHPVCAVSVRLQWGLRVMAERMIRCLPREASSPVVSQLQHPFRTMVVREQARSDFGETVGAVLDSVSAFPLIPAPVRAVIQAVRIAVVSVARAVWDFFF